MEFEWDEAKRVATIAKHGIDFQDAIKIFAGNVFRMDLGLVGGEHRILYVGLLRHREIAVVTTMRGQKLRIITARRARTNERRAYHAHDFGRGAAD